MPKLLFGVAFVSVIGFCQVAIADEAGAVLGKEFAEIRSLLKSFCLDCHNAEAMEGELDLERFATVEQVRRDLKPWQAITIQLEAGEMPPKGETQPSAEQRRALLGWTRRMLAAEALARAGDPGRVPLHRLSNTEYNNTVRELTGIDLQPARDFPADGAAGEGFTNAAEALAMSPGMMAKYVNASKQIASHAVLLPDGFRFSPKATRRDWTDESLAQLRSFYWQFTSDGSLPLRAYLAALLRNRNELNAGTMSIESLAAAEKLSPKYLQILWRALNSDGDSYPLNRLRAIWRTATESELPAMVAEVESWRERLWSFEKIGSYRSPTRQIARAPIVAESHAMRLAPELQPGQSEVVLYLLAHDLNDTASRGQVVWERPRFEGDNLPTLALRDYHEYGSAFEIDYSTLYAATERYLAAVVESANREIEIAELARKHRIEEAWLERWIDVLALPPMSEPADSESETGRVVSRIDWKLLAEKTVPNPERPAIKGWRRAGTELPVVISNASDETEMVPGRIGGGRIAVHPMPNEFVAVVWKSPVEGRIRVVAKVEHAHPACGNGVAWRLEKQNASQATVLAEGAVELGKGIEIEPINLDVARGDTILLAIDARNSSHICDLTEIELTIAEAATDDPRQWDLAHDVAATIQAGNPHADSYGNRAVWSFVEGPSSARPNQSDATATTASTLARWYAAASNANRKQEAIELAARLQSLLVGERPADGHPDREVYDQLLSPGGPLLRGMELANLALEKPTPVRKFALTPERFSKRTNGETIDNASLALPLNQVTEVRLPAELLRQRRFVVEGRLTGDAASRAVQFVVATERPDDHRPYDPAQPVVVETSGPGHKQFVAGLTEFRNLFPPYLCYPHVIPLDEVVCLKTFHREDEPLKRLMLSDDQAAEIDQLWEEHRFITKYPVVENEYLPLFIGFVTQDQPQSLVDFFEAKRPAFQQAADSFQSDFEAAAPKQLEQLLEFASRAYRRPLQDAEASGLRQLYRSLREKQVTHEEAFRSLIARVFMSPSLLLHLEHAPAGDQPGEVNQWELASRLSYFLWASPPDETLRQLAAEGRLSEPEVLVEQTNRMLADDRVRALAVEFGTQWIHVRGFDQFDEKNENLFPEFDAELRAAMYEEVIRFFQDLIQNDRPVSQLLTADHTFLNQRLAEHYGIPGVNGDGWQRVEGVRQYGRGGILGFGSVQAKQAGASRTSPVLRGNWVVETLLGEKLPRPPPNVPQLPEKETGNGGLTMRQIVQRHVSARECAVCHERIDPFGFAFEKYDPIGRLRQRDLGGLPLDTTATLRDGTRFEGLDGLREYLVAERGDQIKRLFYQRLLGYALGRSTSISDQLLLDDIMQQSQAGQDRFSHAVLAIVRSQQFRMIRGAGYSGE